MRARPPQKREPDPSRSWISADIQIHAYKILLDARVHCAVLNVREVAPHPPPPDPGTPGGTTSMKPSTRKQSPVPSGPNSVPTTSHPHPMSVQTTAPQG